MIDMPYPLRFAVVNGIIAPFRAPKSAEAYRQIWTDDGSPLISSSARLAERLHDELGIYVGLAMRYGDPGIAEVLERLSITGVRRLIVIPMFPHYALSSYESAVVRVREVAGEIAPWLSLKIVPPYFDHPAYIDALIAVAAPHLDAKSSDQTSRHLLFSFHGVPERHIRKSDPSHGHCLNAPNCCENAAPAHKTCYRRHCIATMAAFARKAGLRPGTYSYSFQSRLGPKSGGMKWLEPATDEEIIRLARAGVRRLSVMCPAFTADCLETIEEIGIRGKRTFVSEGGAEFSLIPCLNDHPVWVKALAAIASEHGTISMTQEVASGALNCISQ